MHVRSAPVLRVGRLELGFRKAIRFICGEERPVENKPQEHDQEDESNHCRRVAAEPLPRPPGWALATLANHLTHTAPSDRENYSSDPLAGSSREGEGRKASPGRRPSCNPCFACY